MRRFCVLAGLLVGALAVLCGTAAAEPPSRLSEHVNDRASVLDAASRAEVQTAIDRLIDEDGYDLFVVYVDSFGGRDGIDWATEAAELSQLGADDVLLAVAVEDRTYGISIADEFPVSVDGIRTDEVEPRLRQGDWPGAAVALADGLRGSGDFPVGALVIGGAVVVGGGAYALARRRRQRAPDRPAAVEPTVSDPYPGVSTEDLANQANAALLAVDDAVQTSDQELSAARAHFGEEAVAPFAAALASSRAEMVSAFEIRQVLDDDVPEDEPTRRRMCADIVRLASAADQRLDGHAEAFDRLRGLEADAPGYLTGLAARRDTISAAVPAAEAAWTALRGRFAPAALAPVAENLGQAGALLAAAGAEIEEGRAAAPAQAVVSGRAAEDALTQAEQLLDGIPRRDRELVAATDRIPATRAELEQDIAEARALPDVPEPTVARAEAALAAAEEAATAALPDPIAALHLMDEAGGALDRAIADAREAAERARKASAALDQALVTAGAAVAAAGDFVNTRRGAVGPSARTRLAEARRHLDLARADGEPVGRLQAAHRAEGLAQEALSRAQEDVQQWSPPAPGGSNLGVDLGSLVLGGIVSGALRGGGGFGGGGFGGGGRSPGSFGGSATRGRRGGGGRF